MSLEITKMDLFDTCGVSAQDLDALKVDECYQSDEVEGCDMYNGAKIGRSTIGELMRSGNKEVINPFIEGVELMEKFQGIGTTFLN